MRDVIDDVYRLSVCFGRCIFFKGRGVWGLMPNCQTGDGDDANRAQDTLTEVSTVKRAVSGASER